MTYKLIFSSYILLEKTVSQLTGFLTETCPSVSYLLLTIFYQRAIGWPRPWPLPPVRGSPGREGVTDPTLPSQWEVLKAWQVWVTCLAVGWSEPAVERKQVFLGPIFCLPLWTLLLSSCSQRRSLMPFLLDSSLLIQCTKKWDITTNH